MPDYEAESKIGAITHANGEKTKAVLQQYSLGYLWEQVSVCFNGTLVGPFNVPS